MKKEYEGLVRDLINQPKDNLDPVELKVTNAEGVKTKVKGTVIHKHTYSEPAEPPIGHTETLLVDDNNFYVLFDGLVSLLAEETLGNGSADLFFEKGHIFGEIEPERLTEKIDEWTEELLLIKGQL